MSGAPPGYESLEAQFAEIARVLMERADEQFRLAVPALYGDKINLGQAGGFVGVLPETLGGTGTTTGLAGGNIDGILVDDDGAIVIDDDGNIVTE